MQSRFPVWPLVPLFAIAVTCDAAPAASPMQPGMWELSIASTLGGRRDPPETYRECVSQKDLDDETRTLPRPDGDCRLSNIVHNGNRTTYNITCRQDGVTSLGRMEVNYAGDMYDGKGELSIITPGNAGAPMSVAINARRIGECSK
jgi:hypothetical protein